jgi:hypothetical protein
LASASPSSAAASVPRRFIAWAIVVDMSCSVVRLDAAGPLFDGMAGAPGPLPTLET